MKESEKTSVKVFGGEKYYFADWSKSKATAINKAKRYRKAGYSARVVPHHGYRGRNWIVYTKPYAKYTL